MQSDKRSAEPRNPAEWYAEVPRSIRLHSLVGLALIAISFGGFGYWAFAAPLAAAIIAQGSFVANGNNKIVQHLEGGIIEELLVAEGDKVKAGDILVKLDQTVARANARMLNLKRLRLEAVVGRLRAEAVGEDAFSLPQIVARQADDPDVRAIMILPVGSGLTVPILNSEETAANGTDYSYALSPPNKDSSNVWRGDAKGLTTVTPPDVKPS